MDSCELMRLNYYRCFSFDPHGPILTCFARIQAIDYNPFSKTAQSIQGLPPKVLNQQQIVPKTSKKGG
jgi:hypothetical protein